MTFNILVPVIVLFVFMYPIAKGEPDAIGKKTWNTGQKFKFWFVLIALIGAMGIGFWNFEKLTSLQNNEAVTGEPFVYVAWASIAILLFKVLGRLAKGWIKWIVRIVFSLAFLFIFLSNGIFQGGMSSPIPDFSQNSTVQGINGYLEDFADSDFVDGIDSWVLGLHDWVKGIEIDFGIETTVPFPETETGNNDETPRSTAQPVTGGEGNCLLVISSDGFVNFRSTPNTNQEPISQLTTGTQISNYSVDLNGDYYPVIIGNQSGFVYRNGVTEQPCSN